MAGKWTLITEWFWPHHEMRRAELTRALSENLKCAEVEKVILYAETLEGLEAFRGYEKLSVVEPKKRPTYNRLIENANCLGPDRSVVIANNDISFRFFENFTPQNDTVYCSTRHELINDGIVWFDDVIDHRAQGGKRKNHIWSQDAWFFQTPLRLKGGNYVMGTPGCDNKIAWHFFKSGYRILNNGRDIKLVHHHEELERNYDRAKLPSPFLYPSISGKNRIALFPMHPPYGTRFASLVWHIGKSLFLSPGDFLFTMRFLIEVAIFRKQLNFKIGDREHH